MTATKTPDRNTANSRPDAPVPAGRPVSGPVGGTDTAARARAVSDALTANPGGTAAAIATAAGVSRSAAGKILTALESDGHATRTAGTRAGGKRTADQWHPAGPVRADEGENDTADTSPATAEEETTPGPGASAGPDSATTGESGADAPPADEFADAAGGHPAADTPAAPPSPASGGEPEPASMAGEARQALTALAEKVAAALEALAGDDTASALTHAEEIYTGSAKARRMIKDVATGRKSRAMGTRSRPGELRDKVLAHLRANPGTEFTPYEIGRAIGHSAGAVAVSLDSLTGRGQAVLICERPRRYALDPAADTAA